jgi:hypothetical protein
MIVTPPDKTIEMPNPEISLKLSGEDLDWVLRAANVLSSPFIAVESNGSKVFVKTFDSTNDAAHTDSIEIAEGNGDIYCMIFKTENLKVISGGYSIKISSKGIANFKHETANIQYWMALKMFTNASQGFEDQSIAINPDIVAAVFELIAPDNNIKLQMRTVIFGVNGTDWHVKEPYLEVVARLNEPN